MKKKDVKIMGGTSSYTEIVSEDQFAADLEEADKKMLKENLEKLKWWNGEER